MGKGETTLQTEFISPSNWRSRIQGEANKRTEKVLSVRKANLEGTGIKNLLGL